MQITCTTTAYSALQLSDTCLAYVLDDRGKQQLRQLIDTAVDSEGGISCKKTSRGLE